MNKRYICCSKGNYQCYKCYNYALEYIKSRYIKTICISRIQNGFPNADYTIYSEILDVT